MTTERKTYTFPAHLLIAGDVIAGSGFLVHSAEPVGSRIKIVGNHPLSLMTTRWLSPYERVTVYV